METPFAHVHVLHLSKSRRRRSRSLTAWNSSRPDSTAQNHQQKEFWDELQKHRQKQYSDHEEQQEDNLHQSVSTKKQRRNNALSSKNRASSAMVISALVKKDKRVTTGKSTAAQQNEPYQGVATRLPQWTAVPLMRSKSEINETPTNEVENKHKQEDEHRPQVTRILRSESVKSFGKQSSVEMNKSSHVHSFVTMKHPNTDSNTEGKDPCLNVSDTSSYPLMTSTSNKMANSELFDQEFFLANTKKHSGDNDVRNRGVLKTNERENPYIMETQKPLMRYSASLMLAIIAIVIGILAFIIALAAFILVMSLRNTVNNSLGTNSTTSGSSSSAASSSSSSGGSLPSSCSAYTTLNDPTRNIYAAGYALGCDNTAPFTNRTSPVWIRFTGSGGTTLPLTTIGMNQCGSTGTGWYLGTMPSSTGQITNGTACFTFAYSVCQYSSSISVANCGSFYIYLLPPAPVCMARYCTI